MSDRPIDFPEWSSDANYPAGSEDWSGQPTKVEPSTGMVEGGFVPGDELGIDYVNWLLNNHAKGLRYLESLVFGQGFIFKDDFFKPAVDTDIWTLTNSGGASDPAVDADNAAGGCGAIHPLTTAGGTSGIQGAQVHIGTNDFGFSSRARVTAGGDAENLAGFIANNDIAVLGTVSGIVRFVTGATNWKAVIGSTAHDTGVAWGSTYQQLTCFRIGGTIYFYIDGELVHSEANATDLGDTAFIRAKSSAGASNEGSMYNDTLALWVKRA